jgi:hypothetical protein
MTGCGAAQTTEHIVNVVVVQQAQSASVQPIAPPAFSCEAPMQPGQRFNWQVYANGVETNRGRFEVRTVDGGQIALDQYAKGTQYQVLAVFQGSYANGQLDVFNTHPNWPEHWVGTCSQGVIQGALEGYTFRVMPAP